MSDAERNGAPADENDAVKPGATSRREIPAAWFWGVLAAVAIVICLTVVGRLIFARRLPELTEAALDAAIQRWQENGPDSYDLEIEIEGQRPGIVTVEVRGGVVTRMTRDGQTPSQQRTWSVWAVPGMFDTIERELELAADPEGEMNAPKNTRLWLRCQFDAKYGYPAQFHRAVFGGGPEVLWRVTHFEAK